MFPFLSFLSSCFIVFLLKKLHVITSNDVVFSCVELYRKMHNLFTLKHPPTQRKLCNRVFILVGAEETNSINIFVDDAPLVARCLLVMQRWHPFICEMQPRICLKEMFPIGMNAMKNSRASQYPSVVGEVVDPSNWFRDDK